MCTADSVDFRRLLESKEKEILLIISNRDEIVIEATADEIDGLQQQLSRDIAVRNLDNMSRLLREVREALPRIEDEIYGVCLRCEEPIPPQRLKAVPWAPFCVSCQERIDHESIDFAA